MIKGKAMFYVVRLFRYKSVDATVKTKTAVMGVRGTQFGVEIVPSADKKAQMKRIVIADSTDAGFRIAAEALAAGPGDSTRILVFAGIVVAVTPDGTKVQIPAGMTADILASGLVQEYPTTLQGFIDFMEAMGIENVRDILADALGVDDLEKLLEMGEKFQLDQNTVQEVLNRWRDLGILDYLDSVTS
jgi:hypothetical protein